MEKSRQTDLAFGFLIMNLYGQEGYSDIKSNSSISIVRKYYLKLLKSIRFSINQTITVTDKSHKRQLLDKIVNCENTIKKVTSFSELDQSMVAFQAELIFLLLGFVPRRWQSDKFINKKERWSLSHLRQVQYVQTAEHKKNLIFSFIQTKYANRFGDWGDFITNIYWEQCQNDPDKLVNWLANNHFDIYSELF